ncbi:efflux RND transporter permease subunit, partial [Xenorhabdus bovienii]|uniref:efflux RND transporter permease subunit n=1 Tax=Xenorhabdus bovienii TaxID=40576 RepID=UPI0023B2B66C
IDALNNLYLATHMTLGNGESQVQGMVPLRAVATLSTGSAASIRERVNQLPAITFSFNLTKGHALQEALSAIEQARTQLALPESL